MGLQDFKSGALAARQCSLPKLFCNPGSFSDTEHTVSDVTSKVYWKCSKLFDLSEKNSRQLRIWLIIRCTENRTFTELCISQRIRGGSTIYRVLICRWCREFKRSLWSTICSCSCLNWKADSGPNREFDGLCNFAEVCATKRLEGDYEREASTTANMKLIAGRLPDYLINKLVEAWYSIREKGLIPALKDLVKFVKRQGVINNDPGCERVVAMPTTEKAERNHSMEQLTLQIQVGPHPL